MNKSCQFCTSLIPSDAEKCPKCGGLQISTSPIPPPSPYFESVIPTEPPIVPDTIEPVSPAPEILTGKPVAAPAQLSKSNMATIGLVLGVVGIPVGFMLAGCTLPINAIGIFLAWMGLKSEKRGTAIVALILNIGTIIVVILFYFVLALFFGYGLLNGNLTN